MSTKTTGKNLLTTALSHVESVSIREWAMSDHNAATWLKLATTAAAKGMDVHMFAAYIVATAMGM